MNTPPISIKTARRHLKSCDRLTFNDWEIEKHDGGSISATNTKNGRVCWAQKDSKDWTDWRGRPITDPPDNPMNAILAKPTVTMTYTLNGDTKRTAKIIPIEVYFGTSEWCPGGKQWLLRAFDTEMRLLREYALHKCEFVSDEK